MEERIFKHEERLTILSYRCHEEYTFSPTGRITDNIFLEDRDLTESFMRSSGPVLTLLQTRKHGVCCVRNAAKKIWFALFVGIFPRPNI